MARYIDADELRRRVKEKTNPYGKPTLDFKIGVEVLNMIDNTPTIDVVNKIFEEIETVLCRSAYPRINANATITTISSKDLHIRCDDYNAIKKKYTESEGKT